jgi:hypothetical protein
MDPTYLVGEELVVLKLKEELEAGVVPGQHLSAHVHQVLEHLSITLGDVLPNLQVQGWCTISGSTGCDGLEATDLEFIYSSNEQDPGAQSWVNEIQQAGI